MVDINRVELAELSCQRSAETTGLNRHAAFILPEKNRSFGRSANDTFGERTIPTEPLRRARAGYNRTLDY